METMEPPESSGGAVAPPLDPGASPEADQRLEDPDEPAEPEVAEAEAAPPVVAVVVTSGTGRWLEPALASLGAQDYPALSVLVLDNAADTDPTARIAAELPGAYVRRLPEDRGFAAAANEALQSVEGATFLLFCHDDVVLDPDAVRVMVEEAYRSNAAIVGPKLVDYDRPELLLEVGMTVDHYAVPFSTIEPGEIDQEQHDAVRDVFFVSHAAMLVRADLFRELGGFDVDTAPGSDDIDLCWRARLAGARVLVVPAGRVRHRRATALEERRIRRQSPREARAATRARVRVLYKSYSRAALAWVLPSGFVLTLGEAFGLALSRRGRHALAVVAGWIPAQGGLTDLRRARAATQQMREVDDADLRDLMVRGSARLRSFVVQRLHAGDRLAYASDRARARMARTRDQVRRFPAVLAGVVAVLVAFGSRLLVLQRVPEIGGFRAWPGGAALWSTYTSSWRYTMLGGRAPATPAYGLMATLSTVLLGHGALARTVVVAGALPLGAWGVFRLVRMLTGAPFAAVVAATAYAANPVPRDAIAHGELGPLVFFGIAPFVLHALVRVHADGLLRDRTGRDDERASGRLERATRRVRRWRGSARAVVVVGLLGAVAGSVWPPAVLVGVLVAVVLLLALPFAWGERSILRTAGLALLGTVVTAVLLSPWLWSLVGADAASLALRVRAPLSAGDVLRFDVGPAHAGWYTLGLVVAAVVPLVIASGSRLVWATRAWVLALASFLLAWLPTRISATVAVPAPEGVLVPAALGIAVAAGLGVSTLLEDMRRSRFGWRQVSAVATVVGLALPLLALAADTASGRWQLPSTDWPSALAWMRNRPTPGGFRVLWLGDPAVVPVDTKVVDGVGFGLTRDGAGDVRSLWAAPEHGADRMLARALSTARAGDTARLGHLLAPVGVRYVALVSRAAWGHGSTVPADARFADALTRQLDLSVSRVYDGAVVYANDAWIPRRALVPSGTGVTADPGRGLEAAARSRAGADARGVPGPVHDSVSVPPGTLLWAEAAAGGWHARAGGHDLARSTAFDWTNAFALPERASVGIRYRAPLPTRLLVAFEVVLWLLALGLWRRTRLPRVRSRGAS